LEPSSELTEEYKRTQFSMNLFTTQKQNLESIATGLVKQLQVRVTNLTTENCVQEHPEYPSILSLSECLDKWNVRNDAYKIDKTDYDHDDLLFPFIAHFPEQGGRFILVHRIEGEHVHYSDEYQKNALMNENIFLKRWDGVALYAEKTDRSGEADYLGQYVFGFLRKMLYPVAFVLGLSILGLTIISHSFSKGYLAMCLIKCIGCAISMLLLIQSVNPKNSLVQNLCSLVGKGGCDTILKSKYAQLSSWLSWSEIGLYYFMGSFLLLLIYPSSIGLLAWLNLLALPYTIWSLSYQFLNKQWCILCSLIQIALWAEFLVNVSFHSFGKTFDLALLYMFPISFLTPIVLWSLLNISFKRALRPFKQQLNKFKYNTSLFRQVLTNQPRYIVGDELFPILLGNPAASTVITIVSNPYCNPCAKAYAIVDDWLKSKKDIMVKVLFSTPDRDDDFRTVAARHLSSLTLSRDKELAGNALANWYIKKDTYEKWSVQYPIENANENNNITKIQNKWCEMADITFTPTILINGYKLPSAYSLEDLRYFLN
jgi:Peptidase C39 family/Thioredoxin